MTLLFLLLKPILLMLVRRVFKKQMKEFAVQMMEEYAKTTDNDIDDALVAKIRNSMRLGAVYIFLPIKLLRRKESCLYGETLTQMSQSQRI